MVQRGAAVVVTRDLCKRFGRRQVLRDLNLEVPRGSLFGFLGPNGAGKTTTLRILMGLLRPSSGQALVAGHDAWNAGPLARRCVGYLPGDVRFYDRMTGAQVLGFLSHARGARCAHEIRRLARRFELDLRRPVRDYSRGMKQKLGLIAALMHRPALLVLDEPTTSLDPLMREALYDELRSATAEGRTVLLSSHTLSEVEQLCDMVAIIRDGRLIEQERVQALRSRAVRRVEIRLAPSASPRLPLPEGLTILDQRDGHITAAWRGEMDRLVTWLMRNAVADLTIAPASLEDLFRSYYGPTPAGVPHEARASTTPADLARPTPGLQAAADAASGVERPA